MRRSAPFVRRRLTIAALCFSGLIGSALAGPDAPLDVGAVALGAGAHSRAEGAMAMDGAVAAALIGAIRGQFDSQDTIGIKLDRIRVQPASVRDRQLSGEGRLRIGGDDWIPFRFEALYDTYATRVSYPYLMLGSTGNGQRIEVDSRLARALGHRVDRKLALEFAQQSVDLVLDRITAAPAGDRYLTMQALGTAEFAGEGSTAARVRALYDRRNGHWLRVEYELGAGATRARPMPPAVASR